MFCQLFDGFVWNFIGSPNPLLLKAGRLSVFSFSKLMCWSKIFLGPFGNILAIWYERVHAGRRWLLLQWSRFSIFQIVFSSLFLHKWIGIIVLTRSGLVLWTICRKFSSIKWKNDFLKLLLFKVFLKSETDISQVSGVSRFTFDVIGNFSFLSFEMGESYFMLCENVSCLLFPAA